MGFAWVEYIDAICSLDVGRNRSAKVRLYSSRTGGCAIGNGWVTNDRLATISNLHRTRCERYRLRQRCGWQKHRGRMQLADGGGPT